MAIETEEGFVRNPGPAPAPTPNRYTGPLRIGGLNAPPPLNTGMQAAPPPPPAPRPQPTGIFPMQAAPAATIPGPPPMPPMPVGPGPTDLSHAPGGLTIAQPGTGGFQPPGNLAAILAALRFFQGPQTAGSSSLDLYNVLQRMRERDESGMGGGIAG